MKIVKNTCFGGFGLSTEAEELYRELSGQQWSYSRHDYRADSILVLVVERLGDRANGAFAKLKVVEIPDDVEWEIDDYDGVETIHEKHRSW